MDAKGSYVNQLKNTIKDLQNQIKNLEELINILRKEKFGPSSEKTRKPDLDGQISLFNKAEVETQSDTKEPILHDVGGYFREGKRTNREEIIKDLPVREVLCESVPADQYCLQCGTYLKPIGKEMVREELEYIPAKLQIVRYFRMSYESVHSVSTQSIHISRRR